METCWFCEKRPANPNSALQVRFQGEKLGTTKTGFKQYTTTYEGRVVNVPRCQACALNHRRASRGSLKYSLLGTLGVLTLLFKMLTYGMADTVLTVAGALALLIWIVQTVRIRLSMGETAPDTKALSYPAVEELRKQGWKQGF